MSAIESLSHITLLVSDLARSAEFLRRVFDAEELYDSGSQPHSLAPEKFFHIAGLWLVLMEGPPLAERSYRHIAFKLAAAALPHYQARIEALGLTLRPTRPRGPGEAQSLYFYDYDNHLFELHSGTLHERLAAYRAQALQDKESPP